MTARKKTTKPETRPVTVADLILALATWPLDAEVYMSDPYAALLARVEGEPEGAESDGVIWEPMANTSIVAQRPQHYQRPDIVERIVRRTDPLDDFAAAKEFLEWLRAQRYGMPQVATGGGHNEPTSYRDLSPAELAEEFARRES